MKRILLIEDDRLIAKIYENHLVDRQMHVDVAHTGERALELLQQKMPDFVLLDLMLPGINGIEVIKAIRSKPNGTDIPVVVFSNAFLRSFTEAAYRAGATKCLCKENCMPANVAQLVEELCSANHAISPAESATRRNGEISQEPTLKTLRDSVLNGSAEAVPKMRIQLQTLSKASTAADRSTKLAELYQPLHSLASNAAVAGFHSLAQLASGLEALVKELEQKAEKLTSSTLRTIAQALDALPELTANDRSTTAPTQPLILVLDDDKYSRQAVCSSLARTALRPVCASKPEVALELTNDNAFDLIFLDVEMPGLNGFEVCARLRAGALNSNTPVIFVTNLTDFTTRAQTIRSGGADVIAKPFLLTELAVKTLTTLSRNRTQVARETVPL